MNLLVVISTMSTSGERADGEDPEALKHNADATRLSQSFRRVAERVQPAIVTTETLCGLRKTLNWATRETPLRSKREGDDFDRRSACGRRDQPQKCVDKMLGLDRAELAPETARQRGFKEDIQGVLISDVAQFGKACHEGVCAGMAILRIDNRPIPDLAEYRSAMRNTSVDKGVLILIGTPQGNHF